MLKVWKLLWKKYLKMNVIKVQIILEVLKILFQYKNQEVNLNLNLRMNVIKLVKI